MQWSDHSVEKQRLEAVEESANEFSEMGPSESVSRVILETVSEGIYCLDIEGRTTFVNPAAARLTGWGPKEMLGKSQHAMVHHSHADGASYERDACPIHRVLQTGEMQHSEADVFWRKDGTCFPVSYTSSPIYVHGVLTGAVISFQDITERIRRENWRQSKAGVFHRISTRQPLCETLQLLADAYSAYEPGSAVALLLCDEKTPSHLTLAAGSKLPDDFAAELRFLKIESGLHPDVSTLHGLLPSYADRGAPEIERGTVMPMTSANGHLLGVAAFFRLRAPQVPASLPLWEPATETETITFGVVRDLAQIAIESRRLYTELLHQAQHDHLTGLPNRVLIEICLQKAQAEADIDRTRVAVCAIDIDRFRRINESYGHLIGDELIQQLAERLARSVREVDLVGRLTGNEFVAIFPGLGLNADVNMICKRLLLTIAEPFIVQGHSLIISANMGVSLYPDHAGTTESLIHNADTAVQFAKAKGHGKLQVFRPDMAERVRQLAAREAALVSALERNELYLMYQPLYDCHRSLYGFEALLRWNNPELGLIPPDQFIPLAESTGLILPIGGWVLHEACRQAMQWKAAALANAKIFVNVSALQLGQADFTRQVADALKISGLPPSRLGIEVTESLIVPSFKKASARLQPLQELGVSVAIDDFGTGHSSFGALHKLPIDAIKVDRSFVARIDQNASGLSMVRAIVDLAKQLGMKTVGEGVETEAQFQLLHEMECDYFQGFLLSRPLTPEAVQLLFEGDRWTESQGASGLKISA